MSGGWDPIYGDLAMDSGMIGKLVGAVAMGCALFASILGLVYRALKAGFEERYKRSLEGKAQIIDQYKELVEVRDKRIIDLTERVTAQEGEIRQLKILVQVLTEKVNRMAPGV